MLAGQQHRIVLEWAPSWALWSACGLAVAIWSALHLAGPRRRKLWKWPVRLGRAAALAVALFAAARAAGRLLVLATPWPVWALALVAAGAVECVVALYRVERGLVSRRAGTFMLTCRVLLVLAVAAMLAQPVWPASTRRRLRRCVAILVDDSASMHIVDARLTGAEKVRLAEAIDRSVVLRPHRLEIVARRLEALRGEIAAQATSLGVVADARPEARARYLADRRAGVRDSLDRWRQTLEAQVAAVSAPLEGKTPAAAALGKIKSALTVGVAEPLAKAAERLAGNQTPESLGRAHGSVLSAHRRAATVLAEVRGDLAAAGTTLDEACYRSLTGEARGAVDQIAARTRGALARHVLLNGPGKAAGDEQAEAGLLDLCARRYEVKVYVFSAQVEQVDPHKAWPPLPDGAADAELLGAARHTDLTGALARVSSDIPADSLAGIIVLTDGRHNAPREIGPIARRLAMQNVPVCSVVFGSERGPVDAAVASVEAPETVHLRDRTLITVRLKVDGLAGHKLRVKLKAASKVIDSHALDVPSDRFRTEVQLVDEPKTTGPHAYNVVIEALPGEVLRANNFHPLTVHVTSEKARVLLVDGRSRWEFRYLKNLFAGRDQTVRLQYVLLSPDPIAGQAPRKVICASASRPEGVHEATALPDGEAEWLKFDVVILGDVPPDAMSAADMTALRKFVVDRGGTLVVVAGPRYMPHAHPSAELRELLPVLYDPSRQYLGTPDGSESFRIALADEAAGALVVQQAVDAKRNAEIWRSMPPLFWRHPTVAAKPGATVLAYAATEKMPACMTPPDAGALPADQRRARRRYERTHPLIACHNVALGRVMFVAFDRTWRMRYRVGDIYHHKFWGQVLRWATADKMLAGTTLVKLGTDRSHYGPEQSVHLRAKIVKADFSPVDAGDITVRIFQDDREVRRRPMSYVPRSPGIYTADIGALPSGVYRAELASQTVTDLLQIERARTAETHFSVDPSAPIELIELSADRSIVASLAGDLGDVVGPAGSYALPAMLREPDITQVKNRDYFLWDSWALFGLIVVVATCEWAARKKAGLA